MPALHCLGFGAAGPEYNRIANGRETGHLARLFVCVDLLVPFGGDLGDDLAQHVGGLRAGDEIAVVKDQGGDAV
mgnify:CR=1 FL=1